MKKFVTIRTQFPAVHCWPDCNIPSVGYLIFPHRHLFVVKMSWEVSDNNRQIEFISKKQDANKYIAKHFYDKDLRSMSCEDIAEKLLNRFNADSISVFEDGENGCELFKD